jgi:hypothetical protein
MSAVLDQMCLSKIGQAPQTVIPWFLGASYLYYCRNVSLLSDELYDKLALAIRKSWQLLEHPHKYLITEQDLEAGTLYSLTADDYPAVIKSASSRLACMHLGLDVPFKYGVH